VNERLGIAATYCSQRGWRFEQADEHSLIFGVEEANGDLLCVAEVSGERFILRAIYPFIVPRQKRGVMGLFVARANYRTEIGQLDFDETEGEIGLKTGVAGDILALGLSGFAIVAERHLRTANQWLPGVAAICFNDMSPAAALRLGEETYSLADTMRQANDAFTAE
jgi:hypothetical protein